MQLWQNCKNEKTYNKKPQFYKCLHCENKTCIIKNDKVVKSCNKNFKTYKKYSNLNNNFIIKNNKENLKNNGVYEIVNKNIYADNYINKNRCVKFKKCECKFFDKLINNETNNIKLNKKPLGVNVVNSVGGAQNKKWGSHHKAGNYTRENTKSVPKNITTAIICMWLFVLCVCLALVVGVGYFNAKNDNLNVSLNTTTAEGSTFSGGDGTESNPYQIATYVDLQTLASNCNSDFTTEGEHYANKYFKVMNDITIDASTWDPIAYDLPTGYLGIPTCVNYFSGIFDGNNKTITISGSISKTLSTDARSGVFGGLFGCVQNGEVKNLNVDFVSTSEDETTVIELETGCATRMRNWFYFGGLVGILNNGSMANCNIDGYIVIDGIGITFGGFVGGGTESTIDNCTLNAFILLGTEDTNYDAAICGVAGIFCGESDATTNVTVKNCKVNDGLYCWSLYCSGGGALCGSIAGCATVVENCAFVGDYFYVKMLGGNDYLGGIAGKATTVRNCKFVSPQNPDDSYIYLDAESSYYTRHVGGIVGSATTVENCYLSANFDKLYAKSSDMGGVYVGFIAGEATTVKDCYADASVENLNSSGDSFGYTGIIAGKATTIQDCGANINVQTVATSASGYFCFIVGYALATTDTDGNMIDPSISNCFIITNIENIGSTAVYNIGTANRTYDSTTKTYTYDNFTAYNCVVVKPTTVSDYTNLPSDLDGVTNGLYVLASDDASLGELKKTSTYLGTGANGFTWNTTDGTAWDFENTWAIYEDANDGYPMLSQFYAPATVEITINITTNVTTENSGLLGQFIIYKLDSNNNVVNQFVATNGSTITFETIKNQQFTIMINYKLYMTTTIDGVSTAQKTYTLADNATIDITITAPSGVNNWIVI